MNRMRYLLELVSSNQISLEDATLEIFYEIYAVYDVEKYVGVDSVLVSLWKNEITVDEAFDQLIKKIS